MCVTTTRVLSFFFFFNDTATTEIYTLSLHDALPISPTPPAYAARRRAAPPARRPPRRPLLKRRRARDRKSTRLNSSHGYISYAVFCLKKKKKREPRLDRANGTGAEGTDRRGGEVAPG